MKNYSKSLFSVFYLFIILFSCKKADIEKVDIDDLTEGWIDSPILSNMPVKFRETIDSTFRVKRAGETYRKGEAFNYSFAHRIYDIKGRVVDLRTNDFFLPYYDGSSNSYGTWIDRISFSYPIRFANRIMYSYDSKNRIVGLRFFEGRNGTQEFGQNTILYDEEKKKITRRLDVLNFRDSLIRYIFEYDYSTDEKENIIKELCTYHNMANMNERDRRGIVKKNFYRQYDNQNRLIQKTEEVTYYFTEIQDFYIVGKNVENYEYKPNIVIQTMDNIENAFDEQGNDLYKKVYNSKPQIEQHFVFQYRKHDTHGNWTERITYNAKLQMFVSFTRRKIIY